MLKKILLIALSLFLLVPVLAQTTAYPVPERLMPEILNEYPHDPDAYTQGLLWLDGSLYESTGQEGESSLREVDLTTGDVLRQVDVRRPEGSEAPEYFAEGLALVNGNFIQLTWRAGEAFVYDPETFEQLDTYTYDTEGWGLCTDERYIYMSDSSQYIAIREMDSFELVGRMLVTIQGQPLQPQLLNELECVGDSIFANLWQTDFIVEIDKFSGNIIAVIDASNLLDEAERAELGSGEVLNGIAYNPETETFYITGKNWSKLFEVRFVPAPASASG